MSTLPLSAYLPDGTDLPTSGAIAVRIERGDDGVLRARARDAWGWHMLGDVVEAVIDGKRGWSVVLIQGEVPEALRLPGEDEMREPEGDVPRAPRGVGPRAVK